MTKSDEHKLVFAFWCQDIQQNNTQYNDIQQNETSGLYHKTY
jgi:hypothetical protein